MAQIADIIKYEGDNSTFIWKHPCEDFNALTQLIVHESQEAIFLMNGQALDLFGPGRYTLESQNIPVLGKMLNKATGGDTPFHCEVYFINKTVQMGIKWGTDSKVRFIDPTLGFPVEIGASGELNLMVSDSRKLLVKLVGTMKGIAWNDRDDKEKFTKSIQSSFRPLISTAVKTHLASSIKEKSIDLFEIDEHLEELSDILVKNIRPGFEEYGLTIPQFYINNILLPENDANFNKARELHAFTFQAKYAKARAEAEAAARTAQIEADAATKVAQAEASASVTAAQRQVELEQETTKTEVAKRAAQRQVETEMIAAQGETERAKFEAEKTRIEAQAEADKTRLTGFADVEVERMRGLADAEIMAAKGYTQRDVLQAEVQQAYAAGIGQMGANGGGNGGGMVNDVVSLGAGMAMAGTVGAQMNEMFRGMTNATNQAAAPAAGAPCANCGKPLPAGAKFCLECGAKVVTLAANEIICPVCGKKTGNGKFCMECGAPLVLKCRKCGTDLAPGAKFCPECGEKL